MRRSGKIVASLLGAILAAIVAYGGVELAEDSGSSDPPARSVAADTTPAPPPGTSSGDPRAEEQQPEESATSVNEPEATIDRQVAGIPDSQQAAAAGDVLRLIASGDPLPYDQDGSEFQNREGLLPDLPPGQIYREYTVPTPGSPDRGARRLVISDEGVVYYTDDHYESFTRLDG